MDLVGAGLVGAAAMHLGFQLTVSLVVYPALAQVGPERWSAAHAAHSRRIIPLVVVVYVVVAGALVASAAQGPVSPAWVVAAAGSAVAVGTTLLVAGPTHARLTRPDPASLRRLLVADRVRTGAAVVAVIGAVVWSL